LTGPETGNDAVDVTNDSMKRKMATVPENSMRKKVMTSFQ
jgi:hypothetical protein